MTVFCGTNEHIDRIDESVPTSTWIPILKYCFFKMKIVFQNILCPKFISWHLIVYWLNHFRGNYLSKITWRTLSINGEGRTMPEEYLTLGYLNDLWTSLIYKETLKVCISTICIIWNCITWPLTNILTLYVSPFLRLFS